MVALELDQILVTCVCFVQFICMVWLDKIVLLASRKESWYEALIDMCDRRQLINIKASTFLY